MNDKSIGNVYSEIADIVNQTYRKFGADLLVPTEYGTVVYNKYVIKRIENGFEVIQRTRSETHEFGSAKNALVWIILDHHLKIADAKRLKELDGFTDSAAIDAKIHTKIRSTGDSERYLIHSSKLQRDREKQKQFLYEIDKYTKVAQKCEQTRTIK